MKIHIFFGGLPVHRPRSSASSAEPATHISVRQSRGAEEDPVPAKKHMNKESGWQLSTDGANNQQNIDRVAGNGAIHLAVIGLSFTFIPMMMNGGRWNNHRPLTQAINYLRV